MILRSLELFVSLFDIYQSEVLGPEVIGSSTECSTLGHGLQDYPLLSFLVVLNALY